MRTRKYKLKERTFPIRGTKIAEQKHATINWVNNAVTVETIPLATSISLEKALSGLAPKMDRDQDILFLYITTHGSEHHELALDQRGMDLPDLSAKRLGKMIEALPVKWKAIAISACYSGGFIPHLRNEHTLVMTAARHDRASFGCSDGSDLTYFGRALFKEALPHAASCEVAFHVAKALVEQWEKDQEQKSEPQIHSPEPVLEQLARWRAQTRQRAGRRVEE